MERLTEDCCINDSHCWQVKEAGNRLCKEVCEAQADSGCDDCPLAKAIDKLAAYEDTGATPEMVQRLVQIIKDLGNAGGFDYLKALTQADTEGRLVVLPCKVGDTVWFRSYIRNGDVALGIQPHAVTNTSTYVVVRGEVTDISIPVKQFKKTWFLSREEAEQALKEAKKDG